MTFLLLCYLVRIIKQFSFCSDEIAGRHNLYLCYLTTEYMLYIYCIIYLFFVKILHSKWSISEIAKFRSMLSSKPIQLQLCQFSYSYANSATAMPSLASAMPSRSYSTSMPSTVVAAMPSFSNTAMPNSCGYAEFSYSYEVGNARYRT